MLAVVEAAGHQRPVRVAVEKADQHLHADPWNRQRAVLVTGPAAGHTQPGAGFVTRFALPVEAHLDAALRVAMDVFVGRAGDHGALAADQTRSGMAARQAEGYVPGCGGEAVAVALRRGGVAVGVGLQHLWLIALMAHFGEQPELLIVAVRMVAQVEEMSAGQVRLVAGAAGQLPVMAGGFQRAAGQLAATGAVVEPAGVVVEVQRGGRGVFSAGAAVHVQTRLVEIVIAQRDAVAAGLQAHGETLDADVARSADRRGFQAREGRLVVAEHQHMALVAVPEVVMQAFLLAQALQEVQVALGVLHAIVARRVWAAE